MKEYNCCALKMLDGGTLILRRTDYFTYQDFENDVLKKLQHDVTHVKYTNSLNDLVHFVFDGNPYREMRCL